MCKHHVSYKEAKHQPYPHVFETEGQVICFDLIQVRQMGEWCRQIMDSNTEVYEDFEGNET